MKKAKKSSGIRIPSEQKLIGPYKELRRKYIILSTVVFLISMATFVAGLLLPVFDLDGYEYSVIDGMQIQSYDFIYFIFSPYTFTTLYCLAFDIIFLLVVLFYKKAVFTLMPCLGGCVILYSFLFGSIGINLSGWIFYATSISMSTIGIIITVIYFAIAISLATLHYINMRKYKKLLPKNTAK